MTIQETDNSKSILPGRAFANFFATILFSSILAMSSVFAAILGISSASALTEESEVDVKFTFNPMLTLSLSSADLIIANLIPGTSEDSNTIAVTVNTNNLSGYTLSATVGNSTKNTRNLVHDTLPSNIFSFTTDNTWGYSIDDGAHYSGLPIYTDTPKEIKSTTEAGNSYTNFLIGAKAANTQVSGDYTNVINFFAVANPEPEEPPTPGTTTFYANSPTAVGEMGKPSATAGEEVMLYAPSFKNPGYGFAGWNTQACAA